MKHIFIINPISGNGIVHKVPEMIRSILDDDALFSIRITEYAGHAIEIAREYTQADDVCLYAVGGDGTAHEVLNGLQENVAMAIIPAGSGNDFYWMVGSLKQSLRDILEQTIYGKTVKVDYAMANAIRFLNCTNIGIDANINFRANKLGDRFKFFRRFKKISYLVCAVAELFHLEPFEATFTFNGQSITKKILLTSVMLGRQYGGGFKSTPQASIQDGLLDICMVGVPKPMIKVFYLFPKYYAGKHEQIDIVDLYQARSVTFSTAAPVNVGNDGEIFQGNSVELSIVEKGLNLRVPQSSELK